MYFRELKETPPFTQLVFTTLIVLICGLVVMALAYLVGWVGFGIGINGIEPALRDLTVERNLIFLKVFQALQTVGLFVLPPIIVAYFLHGSPRKYLSLDRWPSLMTVILVIAIVSFSNPLISWLSEINLKLELPAWLSGVEDWMRQAEDQAGEVTEYFLQAGSIGGLLINLFLVALLPAIGEELLFRGVVQQLFRRMTGNVHAAIWISATIFSALHLQFYGFLPRLVLGAMFGYMLVWTGTLWAPMIAHFLNNSAAVVIYYITAKGLTGEGSEGQGASIEVNFYMALLSILFLWIFFKALYLKRRDKHDGYRARRITADHKTDIPPSLE